MNLEGLKNKGQGDGAKAEAPKTLQQQGDAARQQARENPAKPPVQGSSESFNRDVALDREEQDGFNAEVAAEAAAQAAANAGAGIDQGGTLYSSHPVASLRVGRFRFSKTLLRLDSEDNAEFAALLDKLPPTERNRIQKIDEGRAADIVRARRVTEGGATKNFDSSVGAEALDRLNQGRVGKGRLEDGLRGSEDEAFANTGQEDMNDPVKTGSDATDSTTQA